MQSTSELYKSIISKVNHWFEVAVTVGDSGVLIDEYKDWIDFGSLYLNGTFIDSKTAILVDTGSPNDGVRENALISLVTSNQLFDDNMPSVGNAVSGQIEMQIFDAGFNLPRMAEVRPYVRVTDGVSTSEWIPQGVYYIDTRYITKNKDNLDIITITGFDAMLKADQPYTQDAVTKASTVVKNIAERMGLTLDNIDAHVWEIIPQNGGDMIQCSGEYTCREHLQYIAALYGANWTITNEGKLNLIRINDLPYESNLLTDNVGYTINFGNPAYDNTPNAERIVVGV